jgi:FkbM family methyltransferase
MNKKILSSANKVARESVRQLLEPLRAQTHLFVLIRDVFHPGEAIYKHLHFRGEFKVSVSDNASFQAYHFGYQVENALFWAGFAHGWEGTELRLWRTLAADASFIADVGANTGIYALTAAAINPGARIVAIEPVQRIYQKLLANIALNGFDISAVQVAVSDRDGESVLFDTDAEHNYSASLDPTMLDASVATGVPVRTACLDSFLDHLGWPHIDLLKIDVEKHEPAVLAGMQRRLAQNRPTIVIEILDKQIGAAVSQHLGGLCYRCFAIDGAKGLIETRELGNPANRNFLLIPSEQWEARGDHIMRTLV